MNKRLKNTLWSFLAELVVYAGLIALYFFLVLHLLGGWLEHLYASERLVYAAVSLGLILGQGILLSLLTRWLLSWIRSRFEQP